MKRYGSEDAKFTQIKMLDADGKEQTTFRTGEKMVLDLSYHVEKKVTDAVFGYGFSEVTDSGLRNQYPY